jgi:hypothetical protein
VTERQLGTAETAVMCGLEDNGGVWEVNDRPLYLNSYWTLQLLNRLTSNGYVVEKIPNQRYELPLS